MSVTTQKEVKIPLPELLRLRISEVYRYYCNRKSAVILSGTGIKDDHSLSGLMHIFRHALIRAGFEVRFNSRKSLVYSSAGVKTGDRTSRINKPARLVVTRLEFEGEKMSFLAEYYEGIGAVRKQSEALPVVGELEGFIHPTYISIVRCDRKLVGLP